MTPQELADRLNGIEYPVRIPADLIKLAYQHGLVIVHGASDDLMEFRGAIDDEVGAYEGASVRVDFEGVIPDFDDMDHDDIDDLRNFFKREDGGKVIIAHWCADDVYSFTYETDLPHATFDVKEDDGLYCRGIVFRMADLG